MARSDLVSQGAQVKSVSQLVCIHTSKSWRLRQVLSSRVEYRRAYYSQSAKHQDENWLSRESNIQLCRTYTVLRVYSNIIDGLGKLRRQRPRAKDEEVAVLFPSQWHLFHLTRRARIPNASAIDPDHPSKTAHMKTFKHIYMMTLKHIQIHPFP